MAPDGSAIARDVLDRLETAIAARDLPALDGLISDDVALFGSASASFGRSAALEYLRVVAESNTVRWLLDRWSVVHQDDTRLLVAATGQVEFDEGSGPEREAFRLSMELVRSGDAWLVAHFHGSLPAT